MNMHHITKSLFVGAAIAGIGMSSGRAEDPLSGETRAWNVAVEKLKPLFEGTGFKLDEDRLRSLVTDYSTRNSRSLPKGSYSFKQLIERLLPKASDLENPKKGWMRCISGHAWHYGKHPKSGKRLLASYEKGCDWSTGAVVPVERKFFMCPIYNKKDEGMSFEEAVKECIESPECIDPESYRDNRLFAIAQYENKSLEIFYAIEAAADFYYAVDGDQPSRDDIQKDKVRFIKKPAYVLRSGVREKYNDIISAFVKQLFRYRAYYQITGLYDDTEIEKYHGILDMLENGEVGQIDVFSSCVVKGKGEVCFNGIRYDNKIIADKYGEDLCHYLQEFEWNNWLPQENVHLLAPMYSLNSQKRKLEKLKSLFNSWHSEQSKGLEAGNKALDKLKEDLKPFIDKHQSDTETELVFEGFKESVIAESKRRSDKEEERRKDKYEKMREEFKPQGKVLVRFNREGMTLGNMRDLEERIQRNLGAAKKLDEFYRLELAWLKPPTLNVKSKKGSRGGGRDDFEFPRKWPF